MRRRKLDAAAAPHRGSDAYGSTDDFTETFRYDSNRRLTWFDHDEYGSSADFTETFRYDSFGRLTFWEHDGAGEDYTETFSYASSC